MSGYFGIVVQQNIVSPLAIKQKHENRKNIHFRVSVIVYLIRRQEP
jgi:hypothetical protein